MATRTQTYKKIPWTGGVNTSVDPGVLSPNDLQVCDNVVFASSGSRLKRDGFDYLDTDIPTVTHYKSATTTRKLVFNSELISATTDNYIFVVGEKIIVTVTGGSPSGYATTAGFVTAISTTTTTNDTLEYTFTGATSITASATATTAISVKRASSYIATKDYWRTNASNQKVHLYMGFTSQGKLFKHDTNGKRVEVTPASGLGLSATIPFGATALTEADMFVMNDVLIITMSGIGNLPIRYRPETSADFQMLAGSPPDGLYMAEHQGRLWMSDKVNKDRLHYSPPGDPEKWLGVGDSGAIDVVPSDGDPVGIQAICPSFKGRLIVGKSTKTYQILGDSPENFTPQSITDGLGIVSHKSVAQVDLDDMFYASTKGIHSVAATDQFGDFQGGFISSKIQPTFKTWPKNFLKNVKAVHLPDINSVAFSVTENGNTENSAIWLYNYEVQGDAGKGEWYRWPSLSCTSMERVLDANSKQRLLLGTSDGRLVIGQTGLYSDFGSTIRYRVLTGQIYPDGDPFSEKSFKRIAMLFKPTGRFSFTVTVKIDNLAGQAVAYSQEVQGDELGTTFILGTSKLGNAAVLAPHWRSIDGIGNGLRIEIEQNSTNEQVEIYGFAIEWEPTAGVDQETDT